ncbi:MAG: RagB/SusD family nutrient uptake outer membrane protein [Bacteroidales bacterium]|nr:RagB/SusD family nutrient uptake outer membrane protein [Bacteroidales bacterium]
MKKFISIFLSVVLTLSSCSYLDISPDLGLTEEDVFTKYKEFKAFLDAAYDGDAKKAAGSGECPLNLLYGSFPLRMDASSFRFTFSMMTDIADGGRQGLRPYSIKLGVLGENNVFVDSRIAIFQCMFRCIRVANICLEKVDMIQDGTKEDIEDLIGQAYFIRAWAHMTLCNYFGGMPYLDHALQAGEDFDIPRESAIVTYQKAAEDFKLAYDHFALAGRVRRDPGPGQAGHLNNSQQNRPNGVAAMALRGRCLTYAASPLNNKSSDNSLWEAAAKANAEALALAEQYQYDLLTWDKWQNNTWGVAYTNEQLWAWNFGSVKANNAIIVNHLPQPVTNNKSGGGVMPTQGCVDMYETIWGDPLYTEAERNEAYAKTDDGVAGPDGQKHHYYEQNPYKNRDPRMDKTIIYDGATHWKGTSGKPINIYYNGKSWPATSLNGKSRSFGVDWNSAAMAVTSTGYYYGGRWDGNYVSANYQITDPLIRLAEVYLNYAESANEAYGPTGKAPGATLTALEAVNKIRNRAGMPNVQDRFTKDKESLRPRIRNERCVEFMFEGHHYFIDERRWCIAEERMKAPLMGMFIESTTKNATYPNGKKYTRTPIQNQATWKDAMNYFFLPNEEANKLKNFVNNETW